MKLIENLTVYKNQYGYSTIIKNQDQKMYVNVGFKKGQEPEGEVNRIVIENGFLSFYIDKNGIAKPKIVVLDYVMQEGDAYEPEEKEIQDNELPF